ncbi:MAG: hypothetical protein F4148_15230 [Caldilineaceae bacterium SB0675_bin_29]|uniref:Uncharacterized protein n=1 Tax=Caldilineaceae bacterium SB0675_bin_29 TaxID=2605266 RepID=A0A6B1G0S6_9CHLR|nr:hypothetical protein [Caldilineaceae bacterium SB0675_bin_29]
MNDDLWRFPWGTFTGEQVWEFTNFIESIEVIVLPAVYLILVVMVPSVRTLINIWYAIGVWLLGG